MNQSATGRRRFLCQLGGTLLMGRVRPAVTASRTATATATLGMESHGDAAHKSFAAALERELGSAELVTSERITLTVPAVAEDGAVVPVTLESRIDNTDRLVLLAENNPLPLLAAFTLGTPSLPFVTLRVKLNASGEVFALARANGRYYMAKRMVRVVVGGCG